MKFCAKCGLKGDTKEGLCNKCYSKLHPSIDDSKTIVFGICGSCNKIFHRNRWGKYPSLEEAVISVTKETIKIKEKIEVIPKITEYKQEVLIKVLEGEYLLPVKINKVVCSKCRKDTGKYFEGVLQLRDVDEGIIKWILTDIEKREGEGIFIQNIEELKNGIDIYLTSQKYLQILGAKLKKKFKGTVKITRKLFSRNNQTSKHIYRLTVLYKHKIEEVKS